MDHFFQEVILHVVHECFSGQSLETLGEVVDRYKKCIFGSIWSRFSPPQAETKPDFEGILVGFLVILRVRSDSGTIRK